MTPRLGESLPRLSVLWHREIGDRLLVALEEEPRQPWHHLSIPMPSGARVELVQNCPKCDMTGYWCLVAHSAGYPPESPRHRHCQAYHVPCDRCSDGDIAGSGVISLGVATLEEVVPWGKVIPWPRREDGLPDDSIITVDLEGTDAVWFPPDLYDDLSPLSPKYVALCEVKK